MGLPRLAPCLVATCALGVLACSSSSSSPGATIVGAWSTPYQTTTGQKGTEEWFFDADGSCGVSVTVNGSSLCSTSCMYTFDGSTLLVTTMTTVGTVTSSTTYDERVAFTSGGASATVTSACDSGTCLAAIYTRVDSNSNDTCP